MASSMGMMGMGMGMGHPYISSILSFYASLSTAMMLFKTLVPNQIRMYIWFIIQKYFSKPKKSSDFYIVIEEGDGISYNEVYQSAELYLHTVVGPETNSLKIIKRPAESNLSFKFTQTEKVIDFYQGIKLKWVFNFEQEQANYHNKSSRSSNSVEKRYFTLFFDKKYKDTILNSYIPFLLNKAKEIMAENKDLKLHTMASRYSNMSWESIVLQHPSTFETIAMDSSLKKEIMDDLNRFLKRKDFYKKVGKVWKRGYLLYGPPGTGKSSLIAAMANYLKFDIYDLELGNVRDDSELRKLLLRTANRSILVIEDIDCSVKLQNRANNNEKSFSHETFTLSGLLNFIDGLWSSCGVERIIIFTTNNKENLDPALLRPGRMDLHIHMSYLTTDGFRVFAKNYLDIDEHWRFEEIDELIKKMNVTPVEVAEELMKSDDVDASLKGLLNFLKIKFEKSQITNHEENKEQKIDDNINGENHQNGDATSSSSSDDDDDDDSDDE